MALSPGDPFDGASAAFFWQCFNEHLGEFGAELTCGVTKLLVDPPANEVTSLTFSLRYDRSKVAFDPTASGPLGAFSLGGDAPPKDVAPK